MNRVLVVGADGLLGRAVRDRLSADGVASAGTSRRPDRSADGLLYLDLAAADALVWEPPPDVEVAYLCAGITSLKQCLDDPVGTGRVNVAAVPTVAEKLQAAGVFVVYLSSNLVFDGTVPLVSPTTPTCPQTEYGRQKAAVEAWLQAQPEASAIVRLTKVVHPGMALLRQWADDLTAGRVIHPFADMAMAPVSLELTVEALVRVGESRAAGVTQLSAPEDVTYAEAAGLLADVLGADTPLVEPTLAAEHGVEPGARPRHTTLDTSRLVTELGLTPPPGRDVLAAVFAHLA